MGNRENDTRTIVAKKNAVASFILTKLLENKRQTVQCTLFPTASCINFWLSVTLNDSRKHRIFKSLCRSIYTQCRLSKLNCVLLIYFTTCRTIHTMHQLVIQMKGKTLNL